MKPFSRRAFIKLSAMGLGAAVISTGLQGCSDNDNDNNDSTETDGSVDDGLQVSFDHGIASGDPLATSVIIWTRVNPGDSGAESVSVSWEVASDQEFTDLLHSGTTTTSAERDFTIKVDVQNLQPGTIYYYRFHSNGTTTATGQTKTLPEGAVDTVKLAVFSCANYPAGFFHVYGEAAKRNDLDAVVHLGDYLYEYGSDGYATEDAEALGRTLAADNASEILNLADYRKRYALYRSDADLQALHQNTPFIVVWDDHEVTNDSWKNGAENHNEGEGDFTERKLQALQAYFEWLPIRPAYEGDTETIYRRFDFGDLVSLHMLDTRLIARDKQLDYANYIDPATGTFNAPQFISDVSSTSRALLGADQTSWLQFSLAGSNATWQVLGQQVLMGRMNLPAELFFQLANPDPAVILPAFQELATLKGRALAGDPSLTETERARIETVVPYNLDAWDGYAYERELIFGTAIQMDKNLVVLAGDTHNAWANNLKDLSGRAVGVEFATASVSSPGLEDYLSLPPGLEFAMQTELGLTTLVDDLEYVNVNQRGYMVVTFTTERATAEWIFIDTVKSQEYNIDSARTHSLSTLPGAGNRALSTG